MISSSLLLLCILSPCSLYPSQFSLSRVQNIEYNEQCQTLPTREPRLFSISTFSWLLVGRDSLRRTLVTSMIVMGNLSENRLVLAVGIIEHAALFAPCIANNQSFFKICQVFTYWSLLLKCDLSSWCLSYLKTKNVSLQDNMSSNKYEYICPTGLLIPNTNPVNQADDCTACTQHLPNYPCARQLMPFKALYYG